MNTEARKQGLAESLAPEKLETLWKNKTFIPQGKKKTYVFLIHEIYKLDIVVSLNYGYWEVGSP